MTVVMLISGDQIPREEWESIPVATEAVFSSSWIPLAKELNLEYVPLFQSGFDVDEECLDDVMKELFQLRELLVRKIPDETSFIFLARYESVLERLNRLITRLPAAVRKHKTVFIG